MVLELSKQARLFERRRDRFKRGPTRSVGRILESERSEDTGRSPNTAHMCRIIDMRSMAMCHFEFVCDNSKPCFVQYRKSGEQFGAVYVYSIRAYIILICVLIIIHMWSLNIYTKGLKNGKSCCSG